MSKKILAMLLVIVMVISMVPMAASAAVTCSFCGEECALAVDLPTIQNYKCPSCGLDHWIPKNNDPQPCQHDGGTYTDTFEASCVKTGTKNTHCSKCHEIVDTETLPVNENHAFHNGACLLCGKTEAHVCNYEVVKELAPTCVEPGYVWKKCSICGNEKNHEVGVANGEHKYEIVKELAPTCVEPGYVWKKCSVCGNEKNHEVGEANGEHKYEIVKELPGTCTVPAYVWKKCSVCGNEKNHETVVDATKHNYVVVKELAPTCIEAGYVWKKCADCGNEKNHEVGTPVNTHIIENGKCVDCGMEQATFSCEHKNSDVLKHQDANCSFEGFTLSKCKDCKATFTTVIAPNGKHDYVGTDAKEPTCGEAGFKNHKCTICGDETSDVIAPTGKHNYTGTDAKEPTCTEPGFKCHKCTVCGDDITDHIDPLGHNVIVVDEKAPTYLAAGYKTYACSVCGGEKVTEPLPMLVRPSTDGYDYVPRTGSAFVEWLYALIFG